MNNSHVHFVYVHQGSLAPLNQITKNVKAVKTLSDLSDEKEEEYRNFYCDSVYILSRGRSRRHPGRIARTHVQDLPRSHPMLNKIAPSI